MNQLWKVVIWQQSHDIYSTPSTTDRCMCRWACMYACTHAHMHTNTQCNNSLESWIPTLSKLYLLPKEWLLIRLLMLISLGKGQVIDLLYVRPTQTRSCLQKQWEECWRRGKTQCCSQNRCVHIMYICTVHCRKGVRTRI